MCDLSSTSMQRMDVEEAREVRTDRINYLALVSAYTPYVQQV